MRFAILGAGAWGTALGSILTENGHKVIIYGNIPETVAEINSRHTNSAYFGSDIMLPAELTAVGSMSEAVKGAEAIVVAVPTKAYRSVLGELEPLLPGKTHIVSVGKGFDPETHERLSELIRQMIPAEKRYPIVSLIGPSFASEVIRKMLTLVTATCVDIKEGELIQRAFSNRYFRVYTNTDEIGAEYAAGVKNVIAIAAGIMTGLGYGDNTRAALITRGLAEITRLGCGEGGRLETYLGLTGLGDLMLTCNSPLSRNFSAGIVIGKADSASEFIKTNKVTVEGIRTAEAMHFEARRINVEMPIVDAVYQVLYESAKPSEILQTLMSRSLKKEFL